jgi:hypothetical protein
MAEALFGPKTSEMAAAKDLIDGLQILMKHGAINVEGQHDIIFAGPGIDWELSKDEQAKLEELGWHFDEETDSWAMFT